MGQDIFSGSTQAKTALLSMIQGDLTELFGTKAEVDAARGGEADLNTRINTAESSTGVNAAAAAVSAAEAAASASEATSYALRDLHVTNLGSVSTNQTLDCAAYNYFRLEPAGSITLTFSNLAAGTTCLVDLTGAGSYTITWAGATFKWDTAEGAAPILAAGTYRSVMAFVSPDGVSLSGKLAYTRL